MTLPNGYDSSKKTSTEKLKEKWVKKLKQVGTVVGVTAFIIGFIVIIVGDLTAGIWGPMLGIGK
jgi:hypothetical protein